MEPRTRRITAAISAVATVIGLVVALVVLAPASQAVGSNRGRNAALPNDLPFPTTPSDTTTTGPSSAPVTMTLTPIDQSDTAGRVHVVTAALLDTTSNSPVVGVRVLFTISTGPNPGLAGECVGSCTTDVDGKASWTYQSNGQIGVDTILAFGDTNQNDQPDDGEAEASTTQAWTPPTRSRISPHWAGYVQKNLSKNTTMVSAQITVPDLAPQGCVDSRVNASQSAAMWVGFNGDLDEAIYLPQVGIETDCLAGNEGSQCTGKIGGADYYLWWETDPNKPQTSDNCIRGLPIKPGDKVNLSVQHDGNVAYMSAQVLHPDGSESQTWFERFTPPWWVFWPVPFDSMECLVEAPFIFNSGGGTTTLARFGSVQFNDCSAVDTYTPGKTLVRIDMMNHRAVRATTSAVSLSPTGRSSFSVDWKGP